MEGLQEARRGVDERGTRKEGRDTVQEARKRADEAMSRMRGSSRAPPGVVYEAKSASGDGPYFQQVMIQMRNMVHGQTDIVFALESATEDGWSQSARRNASALMSPPCSSQWAEDEDWWVSHRIALAEAARSGQLY